MNAIEIPKKSSSIETALANAFSSILLSHLTLRCIKLKSKVSKIEMHLNASILPNKIYVDADTTFYKDFSIHCFNLRWKKGEGFHHNFLWKRC
jgi:hypothetical protein